MQFLDLDLDLNELGGDISWSGPASHTLLQDPKKSRWSGSCGKLWKVVESRLRSGVDKCFLVVEKIGGLQPGASFQDMFPVWDVSVKKP